MPENPPEFEISNDSGDPVDIRNITGFMPSSGTPGAVNPTLSLQVAGTDGTNLRTLLTDNQGRLVTSALTGFGAEFSFGDVNTAAVTQAPVRRTAYTEQSTNAQRSIVSNNANDSAAGTGARTVRLTYLDQTGAGPFTETLTLNGVTAVNSVATNICFIERIEVLTAGSLGSNAGILSLRSATAGGGVTIWSINATDNQAFGAHHYVPTGKVCNITGMSCGHNGTVVGSGALFFLRARLLNIANPAILQVSDFVRLYGQSSTFSRTYQSPIKITGPAFIEMRVTPESGSALIYRGAFDFFQP